MTLALKKKIAAAYIILHKKKLKGKKRSLWSHEWLLKRNASGAFNQIMNELRIEDPMQMRNFLRMSPADFEELSNKVGSVIRKTDTNFRKAISIQERLAITLRYFASGDSYTSLSVHFRVHKSTISIIISEISQALIDCLREYIAVPNSEEVWNKIEREFEKRWNFPRCRGALDGKHIIIQAPPKSGSLYFNYKGNHSTVLMALVDAQYKFILVSTGCNGRISDGGVFKSSGLSSFLTNELRKQHRKPLPGRTKAIPSVIVADDAFPLREDVMKPFPYHSQGSRRIFNYRLSRARRMVESVFGLLATVFRILRRPINLKIETVDKVVLAICYIHNYLMEKRDSRQTYVPEGTFDREDTELGQIIAGNWRNNGGMPESNLLQFPKQCSNNSCTDSKEIREEFENYFLSPEGEVPWQYKFI